MIICYEDSSESTLGQWYESFKNDHLTIYDSTMQGGLESVRFTLGRVARQSIIYKISVGETVASRPPPTGICDEHTIFCKVSFCLLISLSSEG